MIRWRVTWTGSDGLHRRVERADTAAEAAWIVAIDETNRGFTGLVLLNVHPA